MTTIITKNGTGVPANSSLATGELAVDPTNKKIYTSSNGTNVIEVASTTGIDDNATSTAITIDASENVGIGTNAPAAVGTKTTLEVQGADGGAVRIGDASSNMFIDHDGTAGTRIRANSANLYLGAQTGELSFGSGSGGTTRMTINSSGNVGIGTTNPSEALTVNGTGYFFNSTAEVRLAPDNAIGLDFGAAYTSIPAAQNHGYVATATNSAGGANGDLLIASRTSAATSIRLITGTSPTERMRIDSSGNVGIGTSSPNWITSGTQSSQGVLSLGTADTAVVTGDVIGALSFVTSDGSYTTTYPDGVGAQIAAVCESAVGGSYGLSMSTGTTTGTNRAERVRINSSGNVGIGTSNPSNNLVVSNGGAEGLEVYTNDATFGTGLLSYDRSAVGWLPMTFRAGGSSGDGYKWYSSAGTNTMSLTNLGNVGIGNTSPAYSLHIGDGTTSEVLAIQANNAGKSHIFFGDATDVDAGRITYEHASDACVFSVNGNQNAMRIDSARNLLVGKSSADLTATGFEARSNGQLFATTDSTTTVVFNRQGSDGVVLSVRNDNVQVGSIEVTGSTTDYNTTSDVRLKQNIQDADSSGSIIDAIQVRQYDWKVDGSHDDYGFVAQELEQVYPKAVSKGETEDDTWGVDYSKLVPLLVKEIQELKAEVAALKGA